MRMPPQQSKATRLILGRVASWWSTRTLIVVLLFIAVLTSRAPVFNDFSYTYCAIMGLIASVAAFCQCTRFGRYLTKLRRTNVTLSTAMVLSGIFCIPASVPILLFFPSLCSWSQTLLFFVALPLAGVTVCGTLGLSLGKLTRQWKGWQVCCLVVLLLAGLVVVGGWEFYSRPHVYVYNVLCGYFPGNLYDLILKVPTPLWTVRVLQLLVASSLFLLIFGRGKRVAQSALLLASFVLLVFCREKIGLSYSKDDIASALGGRYESEHFDFIYPASAAFAPHIELIVADAEFRLQQVERRLDTQLTKKITAYYFESPEQKAKYIGAKNVYMAKPWRHEIYLHHLSFPHPVLRHEIAHVVAGEFGDPIFHTSSKKILGLPVLQNVALLEGIAVFADWPDKFTSDFTPHEVTAASNALGVRQPLASLEGVGFFSSSSHNSYMAAGSFVDFVNRQYGIGVVKELFASGGDMKGALGLSVGALEEQWVAFIQQRANESAKEVLQQQLRRPGVFAQKCRNATGRKIEDWKAAVRQHDDDDTLGALEELCSAQPNAAYWQREKAEYYMDRGNFAASALVLASLKDRQKWAWPQVALAMELQAKSFWLQGKWDDAVHVIQEARLGGALSSSQRRMLDVIGYGLENKKPSLLKLFWDDGELPFQVKLIAALLIDPEDDILRYLAARNNLHLETAESVKIVMEQLVESGSLPNSIYREALLLGAKASFLSCAPTRVRYFTKKLMAQEDKMSHHIAADWNDRLTFSSFIHCRAGAD